MIFNRRRTCWSYDYGLISNNGRILRSPIRKETEIYPYKWLSSLRFLLPIQWIAIVQIILMQRTWQLYLMLPKLKKHLH